MACNYVVTAQKSTAVSRSVVGHFTSAKDTNLIISKNTRIEIHLLGSEGLVPLLDVEIYGRIARLELYRPQGEAQDLLFISTERFKFCVLAYDSHTGQIGTRAQGDLHDRVGFPSEIGQRGGVDPDCRMIGLHLYNGMFKVIPMEPNGKLKEAFNVRLEELVVLDVKFLYGCSKPTIVLLYEDTKEARHVKTYEISLKEKDRVDGPWCLSNVEDGANLLIPLPMGGALIIGEQTITYHSGSSFKSIAMNSCVIKAYGKVDADGSRYLLGDHVGNLLVLALECDADKKVIDMKLENLGETSITSTISYLDDGVVYCGSSFGDSQLVKMSSTKNESGSYVEVLESFTNLGPITDFCVVDLDRQGQGQLVTCSGAFKDGSLRVIRNGIGINEQASVDLSGIKGLWSLRPSERSEFDKYIILSFVGETRVLAMTDEELEETEINGFQATEQTLCCGNAINDQLIQVTAKTISLVNCQNLQQVSKWSPPNDSKITVASCNESQILVGTTGGNLVFLEIQGNHLKQVHNKTLEHEISCVNISPLGDSTHSSVCAVGMWTDITVRLLAVPTLEEISTEPLGGEIIPRSVLLASFEGINYLLCALGDGHLFTFILSEENGQLLEKKKISLGTKPIVLNTFRSNGSTHVFAASDRPTVIYSSNKKLMYSNVNLKEANYMCAFNSESFPESMAIATEEKLTIGTVDEIQKLHIRTVPLGEMPRRISHQESSNTFLVSTIKFTTDDNGEEIEEAYLRLVDDSTFEIVNSFALDKNENPCSMTACSLEEDPNVYYIVGTAYAKPQESEPSSGRVLLFSVIDSKLKLVFELPTKGAVYAVEQFNGMLLLTVNSKVHLYEWKDTSEGSRELTLKCSQHGHIIALYLATKGDFVIVGDLMRSITLLLYKPVEGELEEIARDYDPFWMTAVGVLDDETYMGAENSFNLFTVKRNSDAATDEERSRLEVCGQYHLGEFVNRFRHGSLVMKMQQSEGFNVDTILFGTVEGSVGIVASIPKEQFAFFLQVQDVLSRVIKGVGGLVHSEWRSFTNERTTAEAKNFLDGDLIESFLDLPRTKMQEVAKGVDVPVEELSKRIEALQRAIH